MTTDRELLELAAKAAGIELLCWDNERQAMKLPAGEHASRWNPLTDDGDALRLAVKLRMGLDTLGLQGDRTHAHVARMAGVVQVPHDGDPYAATRRAIVRAAAEIGRTA